VAGGEPRASSVRIFAAGRPGPIEELLDPNARSPQALLWVDVDDLADEDRIAEVVGPLALQGFSPALLGDLRAGHVLPRIPGERPDAAFEELRTGLRHRLVAAADMLVEEVAGAPRVTPRRVHVIAGPGWLLTTRPGVGDRPALAVDELIDHVRRIGWPAGPGATASSHDLATLLLRGLVGTFLPAMAALTAHHHKSEAEYLGVIEKNRFLQRRAAAVLENAILKERASVLLLDQWIAALRRPGVAVTQAWFLSRQTLSDAEEILALLSECSQDLRDLIAAQRTSLQLVVAVNAAEQLSLAEDARERGEGLQNLVAWLTALFLIPTLIGTAFAALPGVYMNDPTARAAVVVAAMAGAAGLAAIIVTALRK
jgi:hypothetical protein